MSQPLATAVRVIAPSEVAAATRRELRAAVAAVGGAGLGERFLAGGDGLPGPSVWELLVDAADGAETVRAAVRRVAQPLGLDACVVPVGGEARRRLVVLDVDSTLIEQEVIELIAEHAGSREEVARITDAAMRGELDFAQSLRARVATLAGLDVAVLEEVRRAVRLTAGARTLVGVLHAYGHTVGVVSGGFQEILDPLAAQLAIDHARANRLEVRDGRLTGRVEGEIVDRAVKAEALRSWCARDGVDADQVVAVGDGANDLDMLAAAGLGVAFCAKPALREAADATISIRRLDLVLHLLGVTADEVSSALSGTGLTPGA